MSVRSLGGGGVGASSCPSFRIFCVIAVVLMRFVHSFLLSDRFNVQGRTADRRVSHFGGGVGSRAADKEVILLGDDRALSCQLLSAVAESGEIGRNPLVVVGLLLDQGSFSVRSTVGEVPVRSIDV